MTMPITVSAAVAEQYTWGGGCDGWRLLSGSDLSVIEERVPAGLGEEWHRHQRARQFFYLLAGQAEVRTEHGTAVLLPGEGVEVPPGQAHQFANPGPAEARFLVISSPATREDREPVG
jgi:mannose-6-phosphate isomerase-like protein (cupin superfamily)